MATAPQDEHTRVTLEAWLVTDVGMVREHNEDSAHKETGDGFFIVADGMGGHAAGEVASAMTVESVRATLSAAKPEIDAFKKAPTDSGRRALVQLLQNAVLQAHQSVFQRGQAEADKQGMGTTLDVVLIAGPEAFVAHVGDSRTYLIRDSKPSQVTTDHTVAEVLVIEGKLTIEEAQVSPLRTILVNAIGVSADVGVEMAHVQLRRGDRMLLCSDGLHDYFPVDEEIGQRLGAEKVGDAIAEMVELAKTRGGHDNITGIAIEVLDVVEAVPHIVEGESTQPVELPAANPFAADEPTETAFIPPPGMPARLAGIQSAAPRPAPTPAVNPHDLRQTQPMRAISEPGGTPVGRHQLGRAETWPPKGPADVADGAPAAGADDESSTARTEVMSAVELPADLALATTAEVPTMSATPAAKASADNAPAGAAPKSADSLGEADTGPVTPVERATVAADVADADNADDDKKSKAKKPKSKGNAD